METIPHKRTKIVATVGPASNDPPILRSLFLSGANVVRLNFSHGTPEDHGIVIDNVRQISAELGIHTAVLQDLPGPKVRTGKLAAGVESVRLERGKPLTLTTDEVEGTAQKISVSYKDLPVDVEVGNRLYLADGTIALRITAKTATSISS